MKTWRTVFLIPAMLVTAACSTPTPPVVPVEPVGLSAPHQALTRVALDDVRVADGLNDVQRCRGLLPLSLPDKTDAVLRDALISQLKQTGRYDAASPRRLSAELESMDFQSGFLGKPGQWQLGLKLTNDRQQSLHVKTTLAFPSHFVGFMACRATEQAFSPAMQQLMNELNRDPAFAALLS